MGMASLRRLNREGQERGREDSASAETHIIVAHQPRARIQVRPGILNHDTGREGAAYSQRVR
jgi:hypothetical protein